jgi:uncharacterized membrane protein
VHQESFSGPLPPPSILAAYNKIIPDGADRILQMAERQGLHRESLESRVVDGNLASQRRGSWFAFLIMLAAILGGLYVLSRGESLGGLTTIIVATGGQIGIFIYSRREQRRERIEKSAAMAKSMPRRPS